MLSRLMKTSSPKFIVTPGLVAQLGEARSKIMNRRPKFHELCLNLEEEEELGAMVSAGEEIFNKFGLAIGTRPEYYIIGKPLQTNTEKDTIARHEKDKKEEED
ncbi:hypothetical protein SLE2022_237400 [Rubroshorea leprosula]